MAGGRCPGRSWETTLDAHAADQLLIYLALASERSRFRARELSPHAHTAWLLKSLLGTRVGVQGGADAVQVEVCPASA